MRPARAQGMSVTGSLDESVSVHGTGEDPVTLSANGAGAFVHGGASQNRGATPGPTAGRSTPSRSDRSPPETPKQHAEGLLFPDARTIVATARSVLASAMRRCSAMSMPSAGSVGS